MGPGHVAEALDRVHDRTVPTADRPREFTFGRARQVPSSGVSTVAPPDLELAPLGGDPRPLSEWVTNFHLVLVVLDPYTNESAWLLETGGRILSGFAQADCRVGFAVMAKADDAKRFLGPWAQRFLTFADPDRELVGALGLDALPAFVHIRTDRSVAAQAEGWDPLEWRAAAHDLAREMSWTAPTIPGPSDPGAFTGSPAKG